MNYPMQELAVVGPVLFIVLMIAFPVIGIFAGWKRAAYWGGGNFLFYVIGLVIWIFAHDAIAGMVNNIITPLLQGTGITADITKIAASVAAPGFFIIVLLIGNILLVINYFAWFKRVAKIGKFEKREQKDKKPKPRSVQYRIVNGVIGGVGLPLLLLPTTLTFSQAVMLTTTSPTTRANNSLAAGVYNGLASVSNSMSGFSYYGYSNTLEDIDALFAAVNVATKEVEYIDANGNHKTGTAVEGLKDIVGTGITNVITETKDDADIEAIIQPQVDLLITSWNSLVDGAGTTTDGSRQDLTTLFNSENATELVQKMIEQNMSDKLTIDAGLLEEGAPFGEGGTFDQVYEWYIGKEERGEPMVAQIEINAGSLNNMKQMINNMFTFGSDVSEDAKVTFEQKVDDLAELFFKIK